MRRRDRAILGVVLLSVVPLGCDSDGPASGCRDVGSAGHAITSSDGVLTLSVRPGSIAETLTICIEPADVPLASLATTYRIRPDLAVAVPISVSFRHPLPADPESVAIASIAREDFERNEGRFIALPTTRFDADNDLIVASDQRLSMFYGLVETAEVEVETDGGGGSSTSGDADGSAGSDGSGASASGSEGR